MPKRENRRMSHEIEKTLSTMMLFRSARGGSWWLRRAAVCVLSSLWVFWGVEAQARPKLTKRQIRKLEKWKGLTSIDKSSKNWKPTTYLLMSTSPPKVMSVVMDIHKYSRFMPRVTKSKVVRRRGKKHIWAVMVTNLPWPMRNAWVAVKYTWSTPGKGHYRLKWVRHRGSMKKYWGQLDLYQWGKHYTLAKCTMQAIPDQYITTGRLNEGIVWGAEQLLHRLRGRIDYLRKFNLLKTWVPK